jgi:polynucleotide 5'-hydroxyl-kinase GRC3/NOL9
MPIYEANTSDEDEEIELPTPRLESTPPILPLIPPQESKYVNSNFVINDDNTVYNDHYVIFGLKPNQALIIKGQFILEIQRGALEINGVIYHSNAAPMMFINPVSNSLPLLQATQVLDSSQLENEQTEENDHLFIPDYKSVIKVTNLSTGLETIGRLCPLFKNLFWNFGNMTAEDLRDLNQYELAFHGYTFFPVIKPDNSISVIRYKNWLSEIQSLMKLYQQDQCLKIMVVGGKNSGKSTFLRLLVQHMLSSSDALPINFMDLDPGQPEYSKPDCISLSKVQEIQYGNHLSLTSTQSQLNHYIGFNSPKDQPKRYNILVEDLIHRYESDGALKHESLLINTPGWIKGYGLELTKTLLERVKPTHVVYLNSGTSELDLIIPQRTQLITLQGSFQQSLCRYSSSQLRILKTIAYFHKVDDFKFDFQPVLFTPPVQVSYGTEMGIRAATILSESDISLDHIEDAVEGTICALYSVETLFLDELRVLNKSKLPYLDHKEFMKLSDVQFRSLSMIHSVDRENKLMNLYIPVYEPLDVKSGYTTVLVRGKTEIPVWELASNEVLKKFKKTSLPYISFEKSMGHDKTWKVRKNVQRRGQQ